MNKLFSVISFLLFTGIVSAQNDLKYDSLLARKYGADNNGMKKMTLIILKTGPGDTIGGWRRDSIFAGHMRNIQRMADMGRLMVAGPLSKNEQSYRGIYIFNTASADEAKRYCLDDPAVRAGIFVPLAFEWYVTAALMEIPATHKKITKPRKN